MILKAMSEFHSIRRHYILLRLLQPGQPASQIIFSAGVAGVSFICEKSFCLWVKKQYLFEIHIRTVVRNRFQDESVLGLTGPLVAARRRRRLMNVLTDVLL